MCIDLLKNEKLVKYKLTLNKNLPSVSLETRLRPIDLLSAAYLRKLLSAIAYLAADNRSTNMASTAFLAYRGR